jgi:ribosomal protein S11
VFHAVLHGTRAHAEPLSLDTAKAATKIIDWFAAGQLQILKRGRQEAADAGVKRLYEIVKGKGGKLSEGELKNNHGLEEAAVRQLVASSKGTLKITDKLPGPKGGRRSFDVELV